LGAVRLPTGMTKTKNHGLIVTKLMLVAANARKESDYITWERTMRFAKTTESLASPCFGARLPCNTLIPQNHRTLQWSRRMYNCDYKPRTVTGRVYVSERRRSDGTNSTRARPNVT
jgi:hypothetical protein